MAIKDSQKLGAMRQEARWWSGGEYGQNNKDSCNLFTEMSSGRYDAITVLATLTTSF